MRQAPRSKIECFNVTANRAPRHARGEPPRVGVWYAQRQHLPSGRLPWVPSQGFYVRLNGRFLFRCISPTHSPAIPLRFPAETSSFLYLSN
jgi:hypothetical protein